MILFTLILKQNQYILVKQNRYLCPKCCTTKENT